jgi:RNA polymerase I-specific transcription initiation factor RRN7
MELSEYIDQDWNPESLSQPDEDLQFSQIGDGSDEGTSAPGRNMLATLPTLAQGVALLYLSCCILNLPVFLGDFLEWANERDFPYRDVHNLLPRDMWNRLNVNSKLLMPSRRQLMAVHLQKATLLVYRAYHDRLGLIMPPLNVPLCLYRMVERLALPFDIYPVVRRLAHMLREKFEFPTVFKHSSWPRGMPYLPLASLLIIAVKLLYPFDQKPRQPRSITEPTVAIVDWQAWLKEKEKLDEERTKHLPLTEEEGESIREEDMIEMSGEMMDRYMDWFAQRFITSTESQRLYQRSNLRENMNALFPLDGAATSAPQVETPTQDSEAEDDEDSEFEKPSHLDTPQWRNPRPRDPVGADRLRELTAERLDATQRTLVVQNIVPDSATEQNVKRPGADYKRFRETRELEGAAKAFHTAVAEMIGMPMPELLGGVIHYEWAIEKQWARPHRRKLKRRNDRLYDLS